MPLKRKSQKSPRAAEKVKDTEALMAELHSEDTEVRRQAAIALEEKPIAHEMMARRLSVEEEPQVIQALLIGLLSHATVDIAQLVFEMIYSAKAGRRTIAVDTLRLMPEECTHFLSESINSDDPDVRILTANILQELAGSEIESVLINRLGIETKPNVVGAIVEALTFVGTIECKAAAESARARFEGEEFICFALDTLIELVANKG